MVHERVVVERRRPQIDEMMTELTVEVIERDEVPVIGKDGAREGSGVRERRVVVRRARTEHVETVRDTVRHGEVEIEQSPARPPALRPRVRERA